MESRKVRLIALMSGISKKGSRYYRAVFKSKMSNGVPIVKELFLPVKVGEMCESKGITEDVEVEVTGGFNEYLSLEITDIKRVEEEVF